MKKSYLTLIILLSSSALATEYVSLINKEHTVYDYDSFVDKIVYTEWIDIGNEECTIDFLTSDIYYNKDFTQTKLCTTNQERQKQVHRTSSSGVEIISEETEYQTLEEESTLELIGSHLENDCNNILINNYSYGDGIYHINPLNDLVITETYCDMTTDGGGWTAVWKNYGGPGSTSINTPSLLSNSNTGLVAPYKFKNASLSSVKNDLLYGYYKDKKNIDILKTVRTYDNATTNELFINLDHGLPSHANIVFDLGSNVSFNEIVSGTGGTILNNQVSMVLNGLDYGRTDRILYSETSLGFANEGESADHLNQPSSNLMKDWSARHVIYYTISDGRDSVRCQFKCWAGSETYKIETVWYYK